MSDETLDRLAAPARRALASIGVTQIVQLADHTRERVAALHGMGPRAIEQLSSALEDKGLAFAAPE